MRWMGQNIIQIRSLSNEAATKDFKRVAALRKLWTKYSFRHDILTSTEQQSLNVTRTDRTYHSFGTLSIRQGCPRLIIQPENGTIKRAKEYLRGYFRNAFVRGIGLQEEKETFLENCDSVFFEVLRAMREEDFSELAQYTLGGNETLQFHRSAAHKLTKVQREALNINREDLLGDNGYIIKFPYLRSEMGPYIHSIEFTNVDAVGNSYPMSGEEGEKVFCRYKVMIGGCYKFTSLLNEIRKNSEMWSQRIRTPKDYMFKWPRYTFVELDICQQAHSRMPIKLDNNRQLYDFHVFSF